MPRVHESRLAKDTSEVDIIGPEQANMSKSIASMAKVEGGWQHLEKQALCYRWFSYSDRVLLLRTLLPGKTRIGLYLIAISLQYQ